jgi:hypothetical protein
MSSYGSDSESIASGSAFEGIYDGGGFTITIGNILTNYTGLFATLDRPTPPTIGGIVKNTNIIYQNTISLSPTTVWGGLVGEMSVCSIINCSVIINGNLTLSVGNNGYAGLLCGFMGQESSITNSLITINNSISIEGGNDNEIGLLCGLAEDSIITDCSIVGGTDTYNISLKANENTDSDVGLICGYFGVNITTLTPPLFKNITVSLNNTGDIILDSTTSGQPINNGAICGTIIGATGDITVIENCRININNNQTLTGAFNDFFGQVIDNTQISGCQFNYTTTTNNTSRPLTISPTPVIAPVVYTNSFTDVYSLASGSNYYIPDGSATLVLGSQPILIESQTSPAGIIINGTLYPIGANYSSANSIYSYTIFVKGVGSMYFGFNYNEIFNNIIDTPEECICQVNSCSTNPQTGITADSRVTNIREDKTIRVNVDREFARNSVIYPKFKSYGDYMKYLQAGLKY